MSTAWTIVDDLSQRVQRLEAQFALLSESSVQPASYTVDEFARLVNRSAYTVREWCRFGRIAATRKQTGCGPYRAWVICHEELLRYQREGLLPSSEHTGREEP